MNDFKIYFLLVIIASILSCSKKNEVAVIDLTANWDVIEYAKYKNGEAVSFIQGKPYWHIARYSQGISIENDIYYYRYGTENEPNITDYNVQGNIMISEDQNILFEINNESVQATIVHRNSDSLWIKYYEGVHNLEFKYVKN